jgi:hypothetical protein
MNTTNQYAPPLANLEQTIGAGDQITNAMIESLSMTKTWVRIVSIALFIVAIFTLMGGLAVVVGFGVGSAANAKAGAGALMIGMGFLYLLMAAIYVGLAYYLFQYSSSIGRMLLSDVSINMENALENQRKFWKLAGILVAVGLSITVLGILAAVVIPAFSGVR